MRALRVAGWVFAGLLGAVATGFAIEPGERPAAVAPALLAVAVVVVLVR